MKINTKRGLLAGCLVRRNLTTKFRAACVVAALLSLASLTFAQTPTATSSALPRLVRFGGTLKDLNGNPLTGAVGVTFALYSEQTDGPALWIETQNVTADHNGRYTALLGSTAPEGLPTELFASGQARWVGVQISGQAEQPRVLLVSAPYALKAGDAETIGGLPPSAFVLASGSQGTANGGKSAGASAADAHKNSSPPPSNPDVTGKGAADYIPMWDTTSDIIDSVIFQKSSEIGIATTTPAATLDVNGKTDVRDTLTLYPKSTDNTLAVHGTSFNISSAGKVTFISGQTFPGAGTITGITTASGSGLSGGGTTGTLSLKVPAAGITNAMLADSSITLNANTAGGITTPGAMTLGSTHTIGLKTCSANQLLQYNGTAWACASAGTGTVSSVGLSAPSSDFTVSGSPVTTSGTLGLNWTVAPTNLGTANAIVKRDAGGSFSAGAVVASLGVTGMSTSNSTAGIHGQDTLGGYGVLGVANGTSGQGVWGESFGTQFTTYGPDGVHGQAHSSVGSGVAGLNSDPNGTGVYGSGNTGVFGAGTTGVYGAGSTGVYGTSPGGAGVYAESTTGGWAVDAVNTGSGTGVLAGSASGWAAWFNGNVEVDGNLSKAGGSFKIDHPLDPANKYLYHSFVESPDMMNIYNGNVTTDAQGDVVVELPEWFETLNRDFRYQLTVIGQFAQAIVSTEIADGRFSIKTDKPNVKVSWQVTGIRQDAWANAHRIPLEEAKPELERGSYLHPELYGAPEEKGVLWATAPKAMKQWKEARAKAAAHEVATTAKK